MVAGFFAWIGRFLWGKASTVADTFDQGPVYAFAVLFMVIGALCVVPAIWNILDPWTWTAISNPDIYLAKRAFKL